MGFYKRNKDVFPSVCIESFYSVFHRPMPVNCLAVRRRQTENWSLDRRTNGCVRLAFSRTWYVSENEVFSFNTSDQWDNIVWHFLSSLRRHPPSCPRGENIEPGIPLSPARILLSILRRPGFNLRFLWGLESFMEGESWQKFTNTTPNSRIQGSRLWPEEPVNSSLSVSRDDGP